MVEKRILVVDDDENFHSFLRDALVEEGYEVKSAYDGDGCLKVLSGFDPDLILLDINMPGMDGFETCEKVSEISHAPIIFLSALRTSGTMDKVIDSRAIHYLSKPIRIHELLDKVHAILDDA